MGKYFKSGSLVAMAATAILMSSCAKEFELYDPVKDATAKYEKSWKDTFGNIDPNQDWNMATQVEATMSINEDALADYSLQLYSANPIDNENAKLIADYKVTTDASGQASVSFNVDIAKDTKVVYAARMDNHNRRIYKVANITENGINVSFGAAATKAANDNSGNEYEIPAFTSPYPDNESIEAAVSGYNQCYPNDGWWGNLSENAFVRIDGKKMMNWPHLDNVNNFVIIIENGGTFEVQANSFGAVRDGGKYDIVVKNGGELILNNKNAVIGLGKARLIVQKGGKVTGKKLGTGMPQGTLQDGIWNDGTMELEKLNLFKANVYNNGVMKIKDFDTSNGGRITNNGRVECETFGGTSDQGGEIWTNCLFRCKDYMKGSNFRIGSNAALEAKVIEVYGNLDLNKNAILRASESGIIGNCTINAPTNTNEFALVSIPSLLYYDDNDHTTGTITGSLYLEYNTFRNRSGNDAAYWANVLIGYMQNNAGGISKVGEAPLTIAGSNATNIEEADCSGIGNTPDTPPAPTTESQSWIIACEDLGSTDDYDFNDIVFKVSHVAGQNVATVTPLAAGGIYESHILFNNVALGETHQMLGAKATEGNYPMINTSSITATGTSQTVTVPTDFSLANSMGGFGITVKTNDNINAVIITAPDAGEAPQMFCVPGTWAWPTERTKIQEAYPNFADWNGNSNNIEWYNNPTAGKVLGGN